MGGSAWLQASSLIRRHVSATVALCVFGGVAGGLSIGLWGIARRTATSFERFTAYEHAGTMTLYACPEGLDSTASNPDPCPDYDYRDVLAFLRQQPHVLGVGRHTYALARVARADDPQRSIQQAVNVAVDREALIPIGRPIVVSGRLADPKVASEVVVNETEQQLLNIVVGDQLLITPYRHDEFAAAQEGRAPPSGLATTVTVVGVVRHPNDLSPRLRPSYSSEKSVSALIQAGPAWWTQIHGDAARYGLGVAIQFAPGGSPQDVLSAFAKRWPHRQNGSDDLAFGALGAATIKGAISLEARSFMLLAGFVAIASVVFVGQAVSRQSRREWSDASLLGALGMTKITMAWSQLIRSAVIVTGTTLLAGAVAVAMSPLGPIGIGRAAEIHPGVDLDPLTLAVGLPLVAVLVITAALLPMMAIGRTPKALAIHAGARAGRMLPTTGVAGVAMIGSRRTDGVALGSAVAGVALAAAIGTAAWSLTSSYHELLARPSRYGASWDATVGSAANEQQVKETGQRLAAIPGIRAAGIDSVSGGPGGNGFTMTAFVASVGDPSPPIILRGRPPVGPLEVALGSTTLRRSGVDIGGTVHLPPDDPSHGAEMTVVGVTVINDGCCSLPGSGAFVTQEAFERLAPADATPARFAVWIDPHANRTATLKELQTAFPTTYTEPLPPDQVRDLGLVKNQPLLLAAIVGLLAAAALVHALILSVRRSRRQIGIFKAIGFTSRQVSLSVAWHTSVLVVPGLLIGLPVGVAGGRLIWTTILDNIGIVSEPALPVLALVVISALVFVTAAVASLGPAWSAGRTTAAVALRSE